METKKFIRKEGIEYVTCQHLDEKTVEAEFWLHWIGEKKRLVVCAVCFQQMLGAHVEKARRAVEAFSFIEIERIEEL